MGGNVMRGFDSDQWWDNRSLPQKALIATGFAILGLGLAAAFGWAVMALWNWLMPDIFGLKRIDYWQAWGLVILSCILFKPWSGTDRGRIGERRRKRQLRSYLREDCAEGPSTRTPDAPTAQP
jgi:hypothetical protein